MCTLHAGDHSLSHSSTSDTTYSAITKTCRSFSSPSTALEESAPIRGTAPPLIPNDDGQHPISMKKPQQSTEQNDHSKLVTQATGPEQTSAGTLGSFSEFSRMFNSLIDLFHMEKKEKMILLQEKEERLAKKREIIQDLNNHIEKLESKVIKLEEELQHQHLSQANLDLKNAKDVGNENVSEHTVSLVKDSGKVRNGVSTAHGEKNCLKEILEWTEEDEQEVEYLEEIVRRKEKILTTYRVCMVFMWIYHVMMVITFVCIVAAMLSKVFVPPHY